MKTGEQQILEQQKVFETIYSDASAFAFHTTKDPFVRYLRDRRLLKGLSFLKEKYGDEIYSWKVLVVCGGVGGEGIFFLNRGFTDVTVSDFSSNSIEIASALNRKLKTMLLNAEDLLLGDNSYDLVIVQDGLHHLPRPALGFTEMLRVARYATIVIEPYDSLVGNSIGTEWEEHNGAINYVYRWSKSSVTQTVKSYLLKEYECIKVFRFWDHNVVVRKIVSPLPNKMKLTGVKIIYAMLSLFDFCGNMMVSVVCKKA